MEKIQYSIKKQRIITELAAATSIQELYQTIQKVQSTLGTSIPDASDEDSSQSNSYFRNEDIFD
ncbi:hypothetical protein CR513_29212, partial [Mucuna pruriens]